MEKLVRDRMPEVCATPMTFRIAEEEEMPRLLIKKLSEEVGELATAMKATGGGSEWQVIEELADVKEVLEALEAQLDFGHHIQEAKLRKQKEKGAFWRGVVWDGNR